MSGNKSPTFAALARGLPYRRTARGGVVITLPCGRQLHYADDDVIGEELNEYPRLVERPPPRKTAP